MDALSAVVPAEGAIDAGRVRALLEAQLPEASEFELGECYEGFDCITWRLGTDWAVRLPKTQGAADMQITELQWLPRIAPQLPFRTPAPVRVCPPSDLFPWRWSVVQWIPGATHYEAPLTPQGAHDLGAALRALHQPAAPEAPRNPMRSTSLLQRGARAAKRMNTAAKVAVAAGWYFDAESAQRSYDRGAHSNRPVPHWVHLDLHAGNVITSGGRLAGIVDWVHAGAGDPAADLGQAMVLLPETQWDTLIQGYGGLDPYTFTRARAEAINYALILASVPQPPFAGIGWQALMALGVARRTL